MCVPTQPKFAARVRFDERCVRLTPSEEAEMKPGNRIVLRSMCAFLLLVCAIGRPEPGFTAADRAPSIIEVSAPDMPSAADTIALAARVSSPLPEMPNASGSVEFLDGAVSLGTVVLADDGAAISCSLQVKLPAGGHVITARYSGDTQFVDSVSQPTLVIVGGR
jgi:hypothetical protein